MGIITLLTDFGLIDEYAGVMKGVILSRNPNAQIVDITHNVPPQDVAGASFVLMSSHLYFPASTVHVAVVDPGVGSDRRILAAKHAGQFFLAPDNGLLWPVLKENSNAQIISVTNKKYFLSEISGTFHGRDIFAPVAASISNGLDISLLGESIGLEDMVKSSLSGSVESNGQLVGGVVWIDRFGNLATDITQARLEQFSGERSFYDVQIKAGDQTIYGLVRTYADAPQKLLAAMIGSRGFLEIAVPNGSAEEFLDASPGLEIVVSI